MVPRKTLPAPWFRASLQKQRAFEAQAFAAKTDEGYRLWLGRANMEEMRRQEEREYIAESVKLLRKFAKGFEAKDGFALRDVGQLRGAKLARVKKFAALIRQEQAQPHVEKVVRSRSERQALETHTGQRDIPDRKRFIVYTQKPDQTTVKVVTPKKSKAKKKKKGPGKVRKPHVEIEIEAGGTRVREEYFYIEDYLGEPPETFKDIRRALKKMLPDMPNGYYVMVTSNHGNIGIHVPKRLLMQQLESRYMEYDKVPGASQKDNRGLATVVVGFMLTSVTIEGARREYHERLSRRQLLEKERAKRRREARVKRRQKVCEHDWKRVRGGKRCKKCGKTKRGI